MTSKRIQFDSILKRWGYNVFLQRRVNPYGSEKAEYEIKLEKHTVRSHFNRKAQLQTLANEDPEGITHSFDLTFYFRWDAEPRRGDRIYEANKSLPDHKSTYLIDEALPMRGEKGQIIFWTVGATQETPRGEVG